MKKLVLILTLLSMPWTAFAQDAIYLSGMLGLTSLEVSGSNIDYDTELAYGIRAGVLFNDHVSAGIFINRYDTDKAISPLTQSEYTLTNIMAEVTYYFSEADENSFWVSGLLGVTKAEAENRTVGTPAVVTDDSETAYGFSAGYHFMVAPNFSLSPQVTYIHTDADPNSFSELSGMANVTFWF